MNFFNMVFSNKAIVIPAIAWFIAGTIKVICVVITDRKIDFTRIIGTGGMPSSHTTYIVSLATVVGKIYGWDSGSFAITVALALIVMSDAAGVRRAAGKQAEVLNKLLYSLNDSVQFDENLKELLGHTPLEVLMGAILGIVFGLMLS